MGTEIGAAAVGVAGKVPAWVLPRSQLSDLSSYPFSVSLSVSVV